MAVVETGNEVKYINEIGGKRRKSGSVCLEVELVEGEL